MSDQEETGIGHNSVSDKQLQLFFERIERLDEEKKGIQDDIKDVFAEAKAMGYDSKIMRQVLKLRKMRAEERQEMEMLLDAYLTAIGM